MLRNLGISAIPLHGKLTQVSRQHLSILSSTLSILSSSLSILSSTLSILSSTLSIVCTEMNGDVRNVTITTAARAVSYAVMS